MSLAKRSLVWLDGLSLCFPDPKQETDAISNNDDYTTKSQHGSSISIFLCRKVTLQQHKTYNYVALMSRSNTENIDIGNLMRLSPSEIKDLLSLLPGPPSLKASSWYQLFPQHEHSQHSFVALTHLDIVRFGLGFQSDVLLVRLLLLLLMMFFYHAESPFYHAESPHNLCRVVWWRRASQRHGAQITKLIALARS